MRDFEFEAELEGLVAALSESDLELGAEMFARAAPIACNDKDLPQARVRLAAVSRVECPTRAGAQAILNSAVANAVTMLDNTIAELTNARKAACQGAPLGWPTMGDVTACWLKYKLGVCIEDRSAWTAGTFQSRSVAEVIRRLVRPRDLLANNEIRYVCNEACPNDRFAQTFPRANGVCIAGSPDRIMELCPEFWTAAHAPFREQTIIHEAAHLTHCDHDTPNTIAVGIGWAECLAQFVAVTNGKNLDPDTVAACGFTRTCGGDPKAASDALRRNCGGVVGQPPRLPDWRPKR